MQIKFKVVFFWGWVGDLGYKKRTVCDYNGLLSPAAGCTQIRLGRKLIRDYLFYVLNLQHRLKNGMWGGYFYEQIVLQIHHYGYPIFYQNFI